MNPGKIVDPYPITENLRLGTDFAPQNPPPTFISSNDKGSFTHAAMRCVGIGECRRQEKGTMCPSYRATMEEKHSTRGRAHLLFEMMRGDVIRDGWKSEEVFDALDLCLSCKGCKGDCPVNVDMATYKAEFLSHYYENRLRPRHAYAMGWIHRWARLASHAPRLANAMARLPGAKAPGRNRTRARVAAIRSDYLQTVVPERAERATRASPRLFSGLTPSITISIPK